MTVRHDARDLYNRFAIKKGLVDPVQVSRVTRAQLLNKLLAKAPSESQLGTALLQVPRKSTGRLQTAGLDYAQYDVLLKFRKAAIGTVEERRGVVQIT